MECKLRPTGERRGERQNKAAIKVKNFNSKDEVCIFLLMPRQLILSKVVLIGQKLEWC